MEENCDKIKGISDKKKFEYNGKRMDFSRPAVMGIINLTPDSFYAVSRTSPPGGEVLAKVERKLSDGASIIDLGAVSTRPGAPEVGFEEEQGRLMPVLKDIRNAYPEIIISVDTYRAGIAEIAAGEGADMINDISGGTFDPAMIPLMIRLDIPYIIMHIQGTPRNMQVNPMYEDVTKEVFGFLLQQARTMENRGHHKTILDPGFGFGKTVAHNYTLLKNLDRLAANGYPVLAGLSRKSMINKVLGTNPEEALNGTTVLNTIALLKGASILRVHDVKEAAETVKLYGMTKTDC